MLKLLRLALGMEASLASTSLFTPLLLSYSCAFCALPVMTCPSLIVLMRLSHPWPSRLKLCLISSYKQIPAPLAYLRPLPPPLCAPTCWLCNCSRTSAHRISCLEPLDQKLLEGWLPALCPCNKTQSGAQGRDIHVGFGGWKNLNSGS